LLGVSQNSGADPARVLSYYGLEADGSPNPYNFLEYRGIEDEMTKAIRTFDPVARARLVIAADEKAVRDQPLIVLEYMPNTLFMGEGTTGAAPSSASVLGHAWMPTLGGQG
jgi:hypothetical protein